LARRSAVDPAGTERQDPLDLIGSILRAAGQIEVQAILDPLLVDHRHEADADRPRLVRADHDLPLPLGQDPPAQRLGPEAGQAWQIMGIEDDMVKAKWHVPDL